MVGYNHRQWQWLYIWIYVDTWNGIGFRMGFLTEFMIQRLCCTETRKQNQ